MSSNRSVDGKREPIQEFHSSIGNMSYLPPPDIVYTVPDNNGLANTHYKNGSGDKLDAPTQALLDTPNHEQFAAYIIDDKRDINGEEEAEPKWLPLPLRVYFWVPFVVALALGAIGLEVALHFSHTRQGWPTSGDIVDTDNALHYAYTLPPVIVAAILVALWSWTEVEIKKMQPYVDLVHGDSPPHRSLLLDYTRHNNFFVWLRAAANKHYLVALASLMALLALAFQPLSAALLSVRDIWFPLDGIPSTNRFLLGLNQNLQFSDLTSFLTGAGYAGAAVLYSLGNPPFIKDGYTLGPFDLPTSLTTNGTAVANTTAVKSISNCQPVTVNLAQTQTGWTNSINTENCTVTFFVDHNATSLFGTTLPSCNPQPPAQFSPVIFWFFTYETKPPQASATFCQPTLELWDVTASVDIATGNVTDITPLQPFTSASNFSSLAANITGDPLDGRLYNGIQFDLENPDVFVQRRLEALQLQLPAAMYQAAVQSEPGLVGSFDEDRFVSIANHVYTTYLASVARTVYFLPQDEPFTLQVRTFSKRVLLSDTAVHLLAVAMLLLALIGTLIQLLHRYDRRQLRLKHEPGTIASAVSIGAQTGMGELLAGRQREEDMTHILRGKRFRIDPKSMKIIMEGEDGYEIAASPALRRKSIFAALQATRPWSQRYSTQSPGLPMSPRSPRTPNAVNVSQGV
ncbi:hypothetical protein Agabi119p4_9468 [Agaricus bisporus var. burnettii]|uniref:Uncharacterized protein n=1 Tax=Agaricus bisporus var. burnettii TaxID=192524 RepID=A0A8H7C340_AGABI|nr:hypothetical protein Agabi119p4_9468 [Agaricus bisporus var. burnettii]